MRLEMCVRLWIPAFAGNADLMVRFRDDTLWVWLPVMSGEIRGTP